MLTHSLLKALNIAIEAVIHSDPESRHRLAALEGKAFLLCFKPFDLMLYGCFQGGDLILTTEAPTSIAATITGTPLQLVALRLASHAQRQRFFAEDIEITGDMEFAQQIMHVFDAISIDWEEHASRCIGDIPAYRLAQGLRTGRDWLRKSTQALVSNVDDYLHEETTLAPHPLAVETFLNEVDVVRMDTERLAARIQLLLNTENADETL